MKDRERVFKQPTSQRTVRASVSFPGNDYAELQRIAADARVSLAWVIRDAVHQYLSDRWPLLRSSPNATPRQQKISDR